MDKRESDMSPRKKGFIITGVIILVLIGIIIGVRYFKEEEVEESAAGVVPVEVEEVQPGDVTKAVKLTGFVTPRSDAKLTPKLPAKITAVQVDVGDRVQKGQVLAKLDDSDIKAYQKAAEASNEAARLGLKAAAVDLENAKRALEEMTKQFSDSGVKLPNPDVELPEDIKLPAKPEKQDLERAKVDYKNAQADYALAEAKLKEAQTALDSVHRQSDNTNIISPFNGVVAARLANPGDMANPIQPILVVIDDTEMRVAAGVTEKDINSVTPGMELKVLVKAVGSADANAGTTGSAESDTTSSNGPAADSSNTAVTEESEQVFTGKVVTISPVVDEKTRMFTINIAIPNPKNKLRAGMSAEVQLTTAERRGVVRVPLDAVVDKGDHQVVYIIEQGHTQNRDQEKGNDSGVNSGQSSNSDSNQNSHQQSSSSQTAGNQGSQGNNGNQHKEQYCVQERRVETGLAGQDYIEIISGLSPGETIVTKGQHFLRDGAQVNIKKHQGDTTPASTASRGQSWCRLAQSRAYQWAYSELTDHPSVLRGMLRGVLG
ncbi:MAG TPA: efflux RND transporter periplasmic adaptor subunit [Syntrophomonadaceae bacterium]|nr:efflux RND transporter periplasmic adaptor subunit [Syntrophomonadaceae bacterium]